MEQITSRANPKIRAAAALLSAAERKKTGLFLAEGARLCADAALNGVRIRQCFVTPAAREKYDTLVGRIADSAAEICEIGGSVAEKLSDTAHPQGVFCVCEKPERTLRFDPAGFYVITDGVQNPDNLGAVARSAEAFGAAGLFVAGGCDIFAPKALRSSMGALLRFPVEQTASAAEAVRRLIRSGCAVYAAALTPEATPVTAVPKSRPAACVIGNEGSGVSAETLAACTGSVIIPMAGRAESLNAAAAAAVLLWEFTKDGACPAAEQKPDKVW